MAARKTTRRKTGTRTTAPRRKRTTTAAARRKKSPSKLVNFFVPLFFIFCILFCLGFLMFMGYRTATASAFFDMESIELRGVNNINAEKVKQIVRAETETKGVWNADIEVIKSEVEKFKYAREVSVSRVLPDTVRVIVNEREPVAIVRLDGKDFWADRDGLILDRISEKDQRPPFTMFGWDESDTEKARETNKKRVALYLQLMRDWEVNDLVKRVRAVDLSDLREIQAIIENAGRSVKIRLGDAEFGKRLQKGIEVVAATDQCIDYVITSGDKAITGPCA